MLVSRRQTPAAGVLLCVLCAGLAMGWPIAPVHAGSGDVHVLPLSATAKLKSKLRLKLDTRWVDGTGYRPIVIEAIPTPGPAASDRQIRVTLRPMGQSQRETSALVDIPQGSRSATKVVLVPQDEMWHNISVIVHEGGDRIEELCQDYLTITRTHYWNWTEASPATLFIDADVPPRAQRDTLVSGFRATAIDRNPTHLLPDYRNFIRTFPESNYANMMIANDGSQKVGDIDLLSQMNDVARSELLPLGELPKRWLQLTMFDIVFVSHGDLQALAKDHPQRFEALREWLQAGGVLCVYGVGEKFERLADLEERLKLAERPRAESQKQEYRGWIEPDFSKRLMDLPQVAYGATAYDSGYVEAVATQMEAAGAKSKGSDKPPKTWPFLVRDAGLGYLVAIGDDNPFPGKRSDWTWMLGTIPNDHWMWFRRNGMSMHRTNNDFWNFLIPGVGVAPVVSFLLLITLFAAVIGPVNYLLLGRWRRLYLLLITVPVGAAVVTCSLFLYALVTDGVGVRARLRSFTELDARTGHAVSWSRQSYYASIAPSKGLKFPEDTAVYPLVHEPTSRSGTRSWGQELHWDEGQHLQAGYLPSRSAAQFLVIRAAPTQSRLIVQPQAGGKGPRVKNELSTDIDFLVIADRQSKVEDAASKDAAANSTAGEAAAPAHLTPRTYWQIESLKSGAVGEAKVVSAEEVRRRLNGIYRDNAPAYPEGYDPTLHNNAMDFLSTNYARYVNVDAGHGVPTVASSVLERKLSRLAARSDAMLQPGEFLAITGSPAETPLGVEGMRQDESLHVVHGRW